MSCSWCSERMMMMMTMMMMMIACRLAGRSAPMPKSCSWRRERMMPAATQRRLQDCHLTCERVAGVEPGVDLGADALVFVGFRPQGQAGLQRRQVAQALANDLKPGGRVVEQSAAASEPSNTRPLPSGVPCPWMPGRQNSSHSLFLVCSQDTLLSL